MAKAKSKKTEARVSSGFFDHLTWGNSFVIAVALFAGWNLGNWQGANDPGRDQRLAENRQLELQLKNLSQQIVDYQTLEQVQREAIVKLRVGNKELQAKLASLEQDLQNYRDIIEKNLSPQ